MSDLHSPVAVGGVSLGTGTGRVADAGEEVDAALLILLVKHWLRDI